MSSRVPGSGRAIGALLLLAVGLAAAAWWAVGDGSGEADEAGGVSAGLSAAGALAGSDTAGFARATGPRPFEFPRDYGPHPEYRTEWWYLTGTLESDAGRDFGFQLTFFRTALQPEPVERASVWNTNQVWMAHFAVTDVDAGQHHAFERFARGAAGLAGAMAAPFRVWLHEWELAGTGDAAFPMQLLARQDDTELQLVLDEGKGPVLQGEEGWSRKGPEPGNASYYLSWTRMPARGTVTVDGERHDVVGTAWMDREWSTSALGPDVEGWDWYSLQLSDGRELMFFELRRSDGGTDPMNHGSLVAEDGGVQALASDDVQIEVLDHWESPVDGTRYPARWRIRVPSEELDLTLVPKLADQEMRLSFRYWEGAVDIEGMAGERPVTGSGYVELTGYAGADGVRGGGT